MVTGESAFRGRRDLGYDLPRRTTYPSFMATESTLSPSADAADVIDVTRLRVAIARLSRRLRRHELARLVTVLEEAGYVTRRPDPSDARASTIAITPLGHETMERMRDENTALLSQNLLLLTPEQRAALAAALPSLELLAGPDSRPAPARPLASARGA